MSNLIAIEEEIAKLEEEQKNSKKRLDLLRKSKMQCSNKLKKIKNLQILNC